MIYKLDDEYYVRVLKEKDLDGAYPGWFEDQEVCKYNSHGKFFKTREYFQSFYEGLNMEYQIVWAICHISDGHIGNISLQSISFTNRNAEFAILIGDKRHWGKGVSRKAGKRLIEHGFNKLNLERIYCGTAASNEGMKKLAVDLGMVQEGCRRAHFFLDGNWVDLIEYGLLRREIIHAQLPGQR
jgi:RimJ/RimL family protein N-acetyltransferase